MRGDLGHDVFSVFEEARGADDCYVIEKAFSENRILITNDRDFGARVFKERRPHCGVIFLRLEDERPTNAIGVLQRLLDNYADQLVDSFAVVTEMQVRFSRRSPG